MSDSASSRDEEEQTGREIYEDEITPVEYGVRVAETTSDGWKHHERYWTDEANSPEEALQIAGEKYEEVISDIDDVNTRTITSAEDDEDRSEIPKTQYSTPTDTEELTFSHS